MSSKTVCLCYACFSQAFNSTLFGKKKEEKKKLLLQKLQLSLKAFSRIEKKGGRMLHQTDMAHPPHEPRTGHLCCRLSRATYNKY